MPVTWCVAVGRNANTYTQNYGITREMQTLNLLSFYSKMPFPDGVNTNAYNFFLGSWVTASSSTF